MLKVVTNLWSKWSEFVWTSTLIKPSQSYTACDSPECVRCSRYQQLREESWGKLQKYAENKGWQGLDQLVLAIGEGKRYRDVRSKSPYDQKTQVPAYLQNPNVLYIPTLTKCPWWDPVTLNLGQSLESETKQLKRHFKNILKEFQQVYQIINNSGDAEHTQNHVVKYWKMNTTEEGCWCVFHLYNQGERVDKNCDLCPFTTSAIEALPSFMKGSLFGNACFSVIFPQTAITEHYGPCNVRVRCHLGLEVPDGCSLKVGEEERKWQEQEILLFDDSFLHSAKNCNETEIRAVFMVDLWHPDLSPKERDALINVF